MKEKKEKSNEGLIEIDGEYYNKDGWLICDEDDKLAAYRNAHLKDLKEGISYESLLERELSIYEEKTEGKDFDDDWWNLKEDYNTNLPNFTIIWTLVEDQHGDKEDPNKSKQRPMLVTGKTSSGLIGLMITTTPPGTGFRNHRKLLLKDEYNFGEISYINYDHFVLCPNNQDRETDYLKLSYRDGKGLLAKLETEYTAIKSNYKRSVEHRWLDRLIRDLKEIILERDNNLKEKCRLLQSLKNWL